MYSLLSESIFIDFSQYSRITPNRVDLATWNPPSRMRTGVRFGYFFEIAVIDSNSLILSTAMLQPISIHFSRNRLFLGPFAVIAS